MAGRAITFDFHNTLIHCDPWFELEVRTLPGAFLRWFWQERGAPRTGSQPGRRCGLSSPSSLDHRPWS